MPRMTSWRADIRGIIARREGPISSRRRLGGHLRHGEILGDGDGSVIAAQPLRTSSRSS